MVGSINYLQREGILNVLWTDNSLQLVYWIGSRGQHVFSDLLINAGFKMSWFVIDTQ